VFDKENSIEFPLDFLHYLYNYYMVCALLSHIYHMTSYDTVTSYHVTVTMWHLWYDTFLHFLLYSKSKIKEKEKEKKRNINNNLAVLPSHNTTLGTLSHMMVRSRASCRAVDRNSNLEPSCSRACYFHLVFLLPLSSAFLSFSLPLLCLLTPLYSNFLPLPLQCNSVVAWLSWSCYNCYEH